MGRRVVAGWVVALVGALLALAVAVAPAAAEVSGGVAIPAFYDPPAALPAAPGALVRSEPMRLGASLALPGLSGPLPARATRIMYRSTDAAGAAVAVTGTYLEPTVPWAGGGARPLVSFAEGTQGQGDQCAPSLSLERPVTLTSQTADVGYELPSIYGLLARGVAVVVTDYVGLGTTDLLHTYVNRVDEGHAVLDAARAARRVAGASVTATSPVATFGYSQGGGASASAAELQPAYAPEVKLVGAYAGAPPADLQAVLGGIDGTSLVGAVGWSVNGFAQSYPQLRPVLDANVNATGRAALKRLETQCTVDAVLSFGFKRTSTWTQDGRSLGAIIDADPTARAIVDDQRIGRRTPSAPVRVATGTQDDLVDHAQARQLAVDWCRRGARVTYAPILQLPVPGGTGINHIGGLPADALQAQQWVVDRLSGRAASSNCAALPVLP